MVGHLTDHVSKIVIRQLQNQSPQYVYILLELFATAEVTRWLIPIASLCVTPGKIKCQSLNVTPTFYTVGGSFVLCENMTGHFDPKKLVNGPSL